MFNNNYNCTGVGKSCLMARVMDGNFKLEHQVTIGVEFGFFVMRMDDKITKLQIWDTAGQESFRSITRIFYRGAHAVFLAYDITREDTFQNVVDWLRELKQHASKEVLVYLIGNRADLENERQVEKDRAIEFCKANKIDKFFETSAKTGANVEEVFSLAAKELFLSAKDAPAEPEPTPKGPTNEKQNSSGGTTRGSEGGTHKLDSKKTDSKEKKKGGCC